MSLFSPDTDTERIALTVLTGFLGSGKTTVLNRFLRAPSCADTAVIVNEFGAIALDHLLVEAVSGDMVVLANGCVCCAVRTDLESSLRELLARRDEGTLDFARIVIETSGLADPAPIAHLSLNNPLTAPFIAPARIVTTVDAPCGRMHLEQQWEARKQVALADAILLTQGDLAGAEVEALRAALRRLNPAASLHDCLHGAVDPAVLLQPATRTISDLQLYTQRHRHDEIGTLALTADAPLDWLRVQAWLARLRAEHGERLLRVKGLLDLEGEVQPIAVHGIHHVFHPPVALRAWPEGPRRSALVLITRGLDSEALRASFTEEVLEPSRASPLR
jgi:G3E family GTPase